MTITVAQLNRLTNFKQFKCHNCGTPYYSSRNSKYCCNACKQAGYRLRQEGITNILPIQHQATPNRLQNGISQSETINAEHPFKNDSEKFLKEALKTLKEINTLNNLTNGK